MQRIEPTRIGVCAVMILCAGCGGGTSQRPAIDVDATFNPSPPKVGDVAVALKLTEPDGSRLEGAQVRLEGNMNHAGMKPSFADLQEVEPGLYTGTLDFTMGGDWFVLVTAQLPDGRRLEQKIDVSGVKPR